MAFNFWEAQKKARSRTSLYVTLFILFSLATAYVAEFVMRSVAPEEYSGSFPLIGLIYLGSTFGVAAFQYMMYQSQGGGYVAEAVGARRIDLQPRDQKEVQLLNIVKEMSVAAGVPTPSVFVLDDAREINAFAAGTTKQNAAVTVTRGTLNALNREELQGVVAHEFGHIYNGDMKISLRLAAMVMGFFFIIYISLRLLQFLPRGGREERKGPDPVVLGALILAAAGAFSWFMGSILKAAVSRQREYLADACAVQFTRNTSGIAGALRKIAKEHYHDMPQSGMAYNHLYLNNELSLANLFATHPPLKDRIEAIEGQKYLPEEWKV